MPREIELPDGQIAEFDDNTPDDVIHAFARDYIDQNIGQSQQKAPQESPQREEGFLQSAGRFAQGLPQGLGNKFVGAVQTLTDIVAPNSEFGQNLAAQVGHLKERQAQLPTAERAGITGGEIAADIALSPNKGGLIQRAVTGGAVSGLTTPLDEAGAKNRVAEVAKDSALGYGFGKGFELAGKGIGTAKEGVKNIVKGVKSALPEETQAIAQGLKQKTSDLYKAAEDVGAVFKPKASIKISKEIYNAINDGGPLFKANHGATMSIVSDIQKDIAKRGQIGLRELDQYSQALKDVVSNNTDIAGKINSDGYRALQAVNKIDDLVDNIPKGYLVNSGDARAFGILNEAKKEYSRYRKFEKIANIAEKAEGDPNRIKALLKSFISNKKNLRGYSPEEIRALKIAAKNSTGEGMLKMAGKFGLDLGTSQTAGNTALPVIGAAAAGYGGGLSTGGATIALGTAARQAQKYIARGKLDDALKLIQSSGNPAQVISKIPNRKLQEKLLNHFMTAGGATVGESF